VCIRRSVHGVLYESCVCRVVRMTGVSEQLVELLQERHDLRQQVDMRKIAVDQLQQRLAVTSHDRDVIAGSP